MMKRFSFMRGGARITNCPLLWRADSSGPKEMIPAFKQASRRVDPGGNKPRRSATALPRLRFGITVRVGALATVAERPGQLVRVATNLKLLLGNLADESA